MNAVQAIDKENGEIRLFCEEKIDCWEFGVADNGRGIPSKYLEKIFGVFQTIKDDKKFEGTGIGLSIVKKIVEMYGGDIWVKSEVGDGSVFMFYLKK